MKKYLNIKHILILSLNIILSFLLIITVSFAWLFSKPKDIDISNIGGQLLTNYFHSGNGTEESPFIITRPIHYYNLVHLYQKVEDYSENDYYYQLGTNLDGGEEIYVYNYDNSGNLIENDPYSKELNLACYSGANALLPIGTHDKNFIGHFNGNYITVSNFTIITIDEFDCDIGVFGYVGCDRVNNIYASIENVYYNNVTIDLTNVRNLDSVVERLGVNQTHDASLHIEGENYVSYCGYLAGHIVVNTQFNNVFINDFKIVGGGSGSSAVSNFGYFGCIEDEEGNKIESLEESISSMLQKGISFDEIYSNLTSIRGSVGTTNLEVIITKKEWEDENGVESYDEVIIDVLRENVKEESSFSFSKESELSEGNTVYLTGKTSLTSTINKITAFEKDDGFILHNGDPASMAYIMINEEKNDYVVTNNIQNATVFALDNAGRLFSSTVEKYHEATYLYISRNGITQDISEAITGWSYSGNELSYMDGGVKYYLAFSGTTLGSAGGANKPIIEYTVGSTTYYVKVTGTTVGYTTIENEATEFETDDGGFWKVKDGTSSQYLYVSSSKLIMSTTKSTFVYANNQWILGDKVVYFDTITNTWKTKDSDIDEFFLFYSASSKNYFLNVTSGAFSMPNNTGTKDNVTVPSTTVYWHVPITATPEPIYTVIGGVTYYLNYAGDYNSSTKKGNITLGTSAATASLWYRSGGYYYTKIVSGSTNVNVYLYCDYTNSSWIVNKTARSVYKTMPFNSGGGGTSTGGDKISTTPGYIYQTASTYYDTEKSVISDVINAPVDTYFPLSQRENGNASTINQGYIIGGLTKLTEDFYQMGDVRVRENSKNEISSSYNSISSSYTNIYSIKNGSIINANDVTTFTKYQDTLLNFKELIDSSTNLFGLSFAPSSISLENVMTAHKVVINGNDYQNYEMPRSSIYLNINEKTTLSLIAGKGTNQIDGFYSLHHIERDASGITSIRQIKKIYKVNDDIYYVYDNSSPYSDLYKVYDESDMRRIISTNNNSLFYFEIPVNVGEYAIGSISTSDTLESATLYYLSISNGIKDIASVSSLDKYNLSTDFRNNTYNENSINYTQHSLFQFSVVTKNSSSTDFNIRVVFVDDNLNENYSKGLYNIYITNLSGEDLNLFVLLADDNDNINDEYLYAYKVIYTNSTVTDEVLYNGDKDYFKSCKSLVIEYS